MSITDKQSGSDQKQAGMVAIMVTLILMIVISLIVLGFAQISRRNQRQALDRQLSTQAFYAAESGVNDAAKLIKEAIAAGNPIAAKPDCASTGAGGFYGSLSPVINTEDNVAYTCLMVNASPPRLEYGNVGATSTVIPLKAASGTISDLTLTWRSKDEGSTPADGCPTTKTNVFSHADVWTASNCGYGVLRFDLVPTTGALSLAGLQGGTMTSFIVPLRPGSAGADSSPVDYTPGGGKNLLGVICSQTNCSVTIDELTESQYHLRISSLYKDVSLQITATNGVGATVNLEGAQAVIDATGKAQDVLRRIQVRMPLTGSSSNLLSDFAIQSTEAICKRFSVMDGFFQSDANNAVPGVGDDVTSTTNPLCD